MKINFLIVAGLSLVLVATSCVSSKKFNAQKKSFDTLNESFTQKQSDLNACENAKENYQKQVADLTKQLDERGRKLEELYKENEYLKKNNNVVLNQLESMSVISSLQAESIRKSMENIQSKDNYIQGLQSSLARKDSMNMALVLNLKGVIGDLSDQDINIKVDKGVVLIDISDKLLFKSGSYEVTAKASDVLGKVAKVLKNQPNIEFMVEGHTDNVPYSNGELRDNWDLSVKRATSIIRILQTKYGMDPARMTAAGRSEYLPVSSNSTSDGRTLNRRTRIVIQPQLDQFFKLLEKK